MDSRLKFFLAVARTGKLTTASRQLNMSASALSAQLAALERDLGVILFVRGSRGMRLTPSGELLVAAAQEMEGQWLQAVREMAMVVRGERRIHLAASQTATELFLPAPLGRFREHFPDVHVHLTMGNTARVMRLVEERAVDFGIIEGGLVYGPLKMVNLWEDTLGLVVSTRHPLTRRDTVTVDDVVALDWILREEGSGTRRIFERALSEAGWSPDSLHVIMELSSLRAILAMVANNVGVSMVSTAVSQAQDLVITGIKWMVVKGLKLERHIQLVTREDKEMSPVTGELIKLLQNDARTKERRNLQHQGALERQGDA